MSAKSAAKLAAKYAAMKPLPASVKPQNLQPQLSEPPVKLHAGQPGAGRWDVYVDGHMQRLCVMADRIAGVVLRYTAGKGNRPTTTQTERVYGRVVFVPNGGPPPLREAEPTQAVAKLLGVEPKYEFPDHPAGPVEAAVFDDSKMPRRRVLVAAGPSRTLALAALVAAGVHVGSDDGKDR